MHKINTIVTCWLKIFGCIIFMLLCLNGYRYGLQIAAIGFMVLAIKFFDDSSMSDEELKKKNIDLGQIYIHGIVCELTSWISFFYLKKSDGFVTIAYFSFIVLVINTIGEWLMYKKNLRNTKNEDIKENFTSSSLVFLALMPALMLVVMEFNVYILALTMMATVVVLFIRARQRGIEFAW